MIRSGLSVGMAGWAHWTVPDSLIFLIVGVVSVLNPVVKSKGIYNPTSPYCGYAAIWQEPPMGNIHNLIDLKQ